MTLLAILIGVGTFYLLLTGKLEKIFDLFSPSYDSDYNSTGIGFVLISVILVLICVAICFAIANATISHAIAEFPAIEISK